MDSDLAAEEFFNNNLAKRSGASVRYVETGVVPGRILDERGVMRLLIAIVLVVILPFVWSDGARSDEPRLTFRDRTSGRS